ncbi:MAG: carA2 [Chthoniobacteraceae bacterium]|nr:carA2 [Chthoniobacteraceae bacterium]
MFLNKGDCVGIIGGGLGGLAAACTLAARGHRVILFERSARVGGGIVHFEKAGFRFDPLPGIPADRASLNRIFAEAGERLENYVELTCADPQWRSFFPDGTTLDLTSDPARMSANLEAFASSDTARAYRSFMQWTAGLDELLERSYFWKSINGWRDMFKLRALLNPATLCQLARLRPSRTIGSEVRRLFSDRRLRQLWLEFAQLAGLAPRSSPAMLCGIVNRQANDWFPRGGFTEIPAALERLARELGVQILSNTCIRRILIQDRPIPEVEGVETETGERVRFSAIIANSDVGRTHRELLSGTRACALFEKRDRCEPTCSAVVLHWGLKKRYEHLLHHNFVFSRNPEEEFEAVHRVGNPAPDPTCYLRAPAMSDPSTAPAGGEALSVLIHAPYLRSGHDWARMLPDCRQQIIKKLRTEAGLADIEERILIEHTLTPRDFARDHHLRHGAIYGAASRGRFFGAFKPGNRSVDLRGLYFAGSSVHPGLGMELMSGWIAADALDDDCAGLEAAPEFIEPEVAEF